MASGPKKGVGGVREGSPRWMTAPRFFIHKSFWAAYENQVARVPSEIGVFFITRRGQPSETGSEQL